MRRFLTLITSRGCPSAHAPTHPVGADPADFRDYSGTMALAVTQTQTHLTATPTPTTVTGAE
jgi:hypothetical protein